MDEQNYRWKKYLQELAEPRRKKLFSTTAAVPDEDIKITQLAKEGKPLAQELQLIKATDPISTRVWPLESIETKRKEYLEARSIPYPDPRAREQHLSWIISDALAEIYFPEGFFNNMIFKLEPKYSDFPYKFPENFLGSRNLFIWYMIYVEKGPPHFFKKIEDVIVQRYRVSEIVAPSAYGILNIFMCKGNDQNNCNRFFTRRMKDDIDRELNDWCTLVNNIGREYEETSFKHFFLSNPSSRSSIKDPFQENLYSEPGLIEQAIYNHLIGNYSAAVNLLFPIIEGICWDISVSEHLARGGVFSNDSDLRTRDLKKRKLLTETGQPVKVQHGTPTLKELLKETRMKSIFHPQFVELMCSELFPEERNPILHGKKIEYNSPFQSARLLLVLEYLHTLIKNRSYKYPDQLDPADYWTPEKSGKS